MSSNILYRGLFLVLGIVALSAVAVGVIGLYATLTGGTNAGDEPSILEEFECERFEGDPAMPHDSDFDDPRTVRGDSRLAAFNTTATDAGVRIEVRTNGPLINASASEADGTVVPVERFPDEDRIVITERETTPFRLFIDSVDDNGAVRTVIDICPPS